MPRRRRRRLHDDRRLPPRVRGVRGQVQAAVRRELTDGRPDARASRTGRSSMRSIAPSRRSWTNSPPPARWPTSIITMSTRPAAPWCAASARPACSTLRWQAPLPMLRRSIRAWCAWRAKPGLARRARGFRLRHAGARHRRDCAQRLARTARRGSAQGALGRMARGLRAVGEGGGIGCRRDALRRARRWRLLCARRREDLDLQRRHRAGLHRVRAHRRSAGHARHLGLRGVRRRSRLFHRRADRGDRAASAGDHPVRELPHPRHAPARRPGRRIQDRDAHARYLPRIGRRGGSSASRAARWTRRWRMPRRATCSARRSPTCS